MNVVHQPVMVTEVLEHLEPSRGGLFVDCTVGLGGHARALLTGGASRLIGLDRDPAAVDAARDALREFGDRVEVRSEEHTSELQSHSDLVCRLLLEKKK